MKKLIFLFVLSAWSAAAIAGGTGYIVTAENLHIRKSPYDADGQGVPHDFKQGDTLKDTRLYRGEMIEIYIGKQKGYILPADLKLVFLTPEAAADPELAREDVYFVHEHNPQIYDAPDNGVGSFGKSSDYSYGDVLTRVKRINDRWCEVPGPDGPVYMRAQDLWQMGGVHLLQYLDTQRIEEKFTQQPEERLNIGGIEAIRRWNRFRMFQPAVADNIYCVGSDGVLLFSQPEKHAEKISNSYATGDLIMNFVKLPDNWIAIDDGVGGKAYMHRSQLSFVPVADLRGMLLGDDAAIEINRSPDLVFGNSMFRDGLKAGRYGVWLIIVAFGLLLAANIVSAFLIRGDEATVSHRRLTLYGWSLAIISLLEIWYFTTMGVKGMSWFLSSAAAGKYVVWNYVIFLVLTAAQAFALYGFTALVQEERDFKFSQKWTFGGVAMSFVVIGIAWLFKWGEGAGAPNEWFIIGCVAAAQIPQMIAMWRSHGRQTAQGSKSLGTIPLAYLLALIGTVCLAFMSVVILIIIVFVCAFLFLLIKNMPAMAWDGAMSVLDPYADPDRRKGRINDLAGRRQRGEQDDPLMEKQEEDALKQRDKQELGSKSQF